MAELNENQLLLLDNLIYLEEVTNKKNLTVGKVVEDLLNGGGLEKSRTDDPSKYGTDDEWPAKISHDRWVEILNNIKNDPVLPDLTITNGVDDPDGMRVACFVDSSGDATTVFRGTHGDYEWHDNGQGGYLSDTKQQKEALDYINGLDYNNITVTGHSKGGNKSQYVAILSDKVDRCVSFDGQGFSKEFFDAHSGDIAKNRHKIESISAESDFVNSLLFPVAERTNIKYIDTEHQDNYLHNHCPDIMLDSNGNLRDETKQDIKSDLINKYTEYVDTHYPKPIKSFVIDGLIGGTMEKGSQKESLLHTVVSAAILIDGLDGAVEGTAIGFIDEKVRNFLEDAGQLIKDKAYDAVDLAKDAGNSIKESMVGMENYAENALEYAGNTVKDALTDAGHSVRDAFDDAGRAIDKGIGAISNGIASLLHLNEAYDRDRIEVNITKLYETAEVYRSCRTELEDMLKELNACMENLKAHWEGEAKESYYTNAYPQFTESMKKHINMIAFLEKELAGAADQFQNLDRELRSKLA